MKDIFLFLLLFIHFATAQSSFLDPEQFNLNKFETINERITPPERFYRIPADSGSFAFWLRRTPLLPENSAVKDYKNRVFKKSTDSTVAAVIAYNIKSRKLDQCMDILLRLHTEYMIETGKKDEIRYPLPDGLLLSWPKWKSGIRPKFKGAHFYLEKTAEPDSSDASLRRYLNTIFEYSGTQAFYHYYDDIDPADLQIGNFIVKKGGNGHAVMIVDLARDNDGNLAALIGQGDTPACQFYLLSYEKGNPWFPIDPAEDVLPLPIKKKMYWTGLRRF